MLPNGKVTPVHHLFPLSPPHGQSVPTEMRLWRHVCKLWTTDTNRITPRSVSSPGINQLIRQNYTQSWPLWDYCTTTTTVHIESTTPEEEEER